MKPVIHLKDRMRTRPEPCPRVRKLLLVKTRSPGDIPPLQITNGDRGQAVPVRLTMETSALSVQSLFPTFHLNCLFSYHHLVVKLTHIQQRGCYCVTSHIVGGIKLGLSETSGSLLGTDFPWTHWCNKPHSTVLSALQGVFCDYRFHNKTGREKSRITQISIIMGAFLGTKMVKNLSPM